MIINGIPIKKYKAKVKNFISFTTSPEAVNTDEFKIVEGYVSIRSIVLCYDKDLRKPPRQEYDIVFTTEEIDITRLGGCGMGVSIFHPQVYEEFEIIGEVEEG